MVYGRLNMMPSIEKPEYTTSNVKKQGFVYPDNPLPIKQIPSKIPIPERREHFRKNVEEGLMISNLNRAIKLEELDAHRYRLRNVYQAKKQLHNEIKEKKDEAMEKLKNQRPVVSTTKYHPPQNVKRVLFTKWASEEIQDINYFKQSIRRPLYMPAEVNVQPLVYNLSQAIADTGLQQKQDLIKSKVLEFERLQQKVKAANQIFKSKQVTGVTSRRLKL